MPRTLSPRALRAAQAESTNSAWLALLTISFDPPEATVYRVVNNLEPVTSRGQVFAPTAFELTLPEDSLDRTPQVELSIDNVTLEFIDVLRAMDTPPHVAIEVILSDAPNDVEIAVPDMLLRNITWNAQRINGTLQLDDVFGLTFPGFHALYDPIQYPGLFA